MYLPRNHPSIIQTAGAARMRLGMWLVLVSPDRRHMNSSCRSILENSIRLAGQSIQLSNFRDETCVVDVLPQLAWGTKRPVARITWPCARA